MYAYKLRIEFTWGHQSRIIGLSKTNPSYYYPPPTTILGAIAEPLAKEYRLGENPENTRLLLSKLSSNLLAIGIKPVNAIPLKYMDLNRILAVRKRKETYPSAKSMKAIEGSFDAPARGKTILSSLDYEPPKLDVLIVFKDKEIIYGGRKLSLSNHILWEIHRIGSKESLVSVIDVEESNNISIEEGITITNYSLPLGKGVKILEELGRKWVYEVYVDPHILDPSKTILDYYLEGTKLKTYMVPVKMSLSEEPSVKISVTKPMAIYSIKFSHSEERIIGVYP